MLKVSDNVLDHLAKKKYLSLSCQIEVEINSCWKFLICMLDSCQVSIDHSDILLVQVYGSMLGVLTGILNLKKNLTIETLSFPVFRQYG